MAEQDGGSLVYQVDIETAKMVTGSRKASVVLDEMQRQAGKASKSVDDLSSSAGRAGNSMGGLKTVISGVASAISVALIIDYAKAFLTVADNITQLQSRIARLSTDATAARETFATLSSIASTTGASLQDTAKLWETLTSSLKEAGATNGQVLALTDTLQKIGRVGGSSSEEMANALRQFGQSIASGTVRAEEFNSILEQMPELARQIATGLGMSMGELRQSMLEGKLTAQDALNAIMKQSGAVNEEFKKLPRTMDQASNSLTISLQTLIGKMNDTVGASTTMVTIIDSISAAIDRLSGKTETAAQKIADLTSTADMYERRARTWSWLGLDGWSEQNKALASLSNRAATLVGDLDEVTKATKKAADQAPIAIPTTPSKKGPGGKAGKSQEQKDADAYARSQESVAQKIEQLRQKADLTANSTQELSKAQAVLNAQQSLGKSATQEQIKLAGEYAGKIWDTTNAIRAQQQAEQGKKFAKQEIASTQSTIDPATGQAIDPMAQVNLQEQQKLDALAKYQELDKQNTALYEQAKTAIQADAAMQRRQISDEENERQRQNMSNLLGSTSDFFGQMAGAVGDYAGESSAAYKALFAVSRGFAIAQATMNTVTAISNAAALPWPANIPAIAFAAAQGANLVSQIRGANYGGARKNGGPVSAGSMYQVGEGGMPEIYQASNGSQFMIPGDNGKVISNKDMQGGGGIVIHNNIQNYTGATVDSQARVNPDGSVSIDTIVADLNNGGPISQGISRNHQAPRRATE